MELMFNFTYKLIIEIVLVLILLSSVKIIKTGEVKIVERLGKYRTSLEPGLRFIIPIIDIVARKISTKQQILDVAPSDMISKDNVSVAIDAVIFFKILDPYKAVYCIERYKDAIEYSAVTNLRSIVGSMDLDNLLSERATINANLLRVIDEVTDEYGIKVISVEIKNIELPEALDISMQQQMTAEREKRAAILKSEGQKESQIKTAEGDKQAKILNAEAEKQVTIRKAEGDKESKLMEAEAEASYILKIAEAQAQAIETVNKAILDSGTNETIIALKQIDALVEMAKNPANKLIIPQEALSSIGNITAIAETLKMNK